MTASPCATRPGGRAPRTLGTIARALEGADGVILAADPDREREAIAGQVLDWLEERDAIGDRRVKHAGFHEVTEAAVRAAVPFAARPVRPDGTDVGDPGLASERQRSRCGWAQCRSRTTCRVRP